LRLIAVPIFGLLLAGIGADWLDSGSRAHRLVLAVLLALTVGPAMVVGLQFWRTGGDRGYAFDEAFPGVFEAARATGASPIYLRDRGDLPGYIEAYWYGALQGMDRSAFVRLRNDEIPPAGAVVLGTDKTCGACEVLAEDGDYIAYRAADSSAAGLIPNGDFEATGATLETYGAPIFGWASSADAALFPGGARSDTAHLVLGQITDTTTTKQAASSVVAITDEAWLEVDALVRAGPDSQSTVRATIALVELDAQRAFITWHTTTIDLSPGDDWQQVRIEPVELGPDTAYVNVTCYLEPGGTLGDTVEVDDVVVDDPS